jgi:hypothetical protein
MDREGTWDESGDGRTGLRLEYVESWLQNTAVRWQVVRWRESSQMVGALQFSKVPSIATECFFVSISFTNTCFGPYRPSPTICWLRRLRSTEQYSTVQRFTRNTRHTVLLIPDTARYSTVQYRNSQGTQGIQFCWFRIQYSTVQYRDSQGTQGIQFCWFRIQRGTVQYRDSQGTQGIQFCWFRIQSGTVQYSTEIQEKQQKL